MFWDMECSNCHKVHDLDVAPDTGECLECGGLLLEPGEKLEDHSAGAMEELKALMDGYQKVFLQHGE